MNKNISKVCGPFSSDSIPAFNMKPCQSLPLPTNDLLQLQGLDRAVWPLTEAASCKHTRSVDMGTADNQCNAAHDYENHEPQRERRK